MSEVRRLRIQCDGDSGKNLSVTDAETGKHLPRVVSVKFEADMKQANRIEVVVVGGAIDVTGNATILTVCPRCRQETHATRTENPAKGQTPVPGGLIGSAGVEPSASSHKAFTPTLATFARNPNVSEKR